MMRNTQETQERQIFAGGRQTSRKPNCLNTFGNQVNLSGVSRFDTNSVPVTHQPEEVGRQISGRFKNIYFFGSHVISSDVRSLDSWSC